MKRDTALDAILDKVLAHGPAKKRPPKAKKPGKPGKKKKLPTGSKA